MPPGQSGWSVCVWEEGVCVCVVNEERRSGLPAALTPSTQLKMVNVFCACACMHARASLSNDSVLKPFEHSRSDMTSAVGWVLIANYLSLCCQIHASFTQYSIQNGI